MQGKGAAAFPGRQLRTTTEFRSVQPRKPTSEYDMLGALIISLRSDVVSLAQLWTVLAQGLWRSGPSLYGM
jgi:hypothetical protein